MLAKKLKKLKEQSNNYLKDYVINYILKDYKTDDDIGGFFKDLMMSGCQGGMIGSLIYFKDTHAFYDKFYNEIEEIRLNWEDEIGETLKIKSGSDLKNWFAWFAFEETARKIAEEIGIEI